MSLSPLHAWVARANVAAALQEENMFKPMLSATLTPELLPKLKWPMMSSPKYDGVRCIILNEVAVSRNLKPIRNEYVQSQLAGRPGLEGLDGELIVGSPTDGLVFNRTTSGVSAFKGKPEFTFFVFDTQHPTHCGLSFQHRLKAAALQQFVQPRVKVVEHKFIRSLAALELAEEEYLAAGYEGLMLRAPDSPYKCGRATEKEGWLFKLKRFRDAEAVIVGFEPAYENTNEATRDALGQTKRSSAKGGLVAKPMIGVMLGKDVKTKEPVRMGPGKMTHADRLAYFADPTQIIGRTATYRVFDYGAKDVSRFALFHGFRENGL